MFLTGSSPGGRQLLNRTTIFGRRDLSGLGRREHGGAGAHSRPPGTRSGPTTPFCTRPRATAVRGVVDDRKGEIAPWLVSRRRTKITFWRTHSDS